MGKIEAPYDFWDGIEGRIESSALAQNKGGGKVERMAAVWHLLIAPFGIFCREYFLKGGIFKMRRGLADAVHESVLAFGIRARRYELINADRRGLEILRNELKETGTGREASR